MQADVEDNGSSMTKKKKKKNDKPQEPQEEPRCIICNSTDVRTGWFDNSIFFCYEDGEDFTKRYFDAVLAPKLVHVEPNPDPKHYKYRSSDKTPVGPDSDSNHNEESIESPGTPGQDSQSSKQV